MSHDISHVELALLLRSSYLTHSKPPVVHLLRGAAVVAITGSEAISLPSVLRNSLSWPVNDPDVGVVQGKAHAKAKSCWPEVLHKVLGYRKVIFCGHGSGGGVAAIMAAWMVKAGGVEVELVTFGAPKVGGRVLTRILEGATCTRYVTSKDIMPRVGLPLAEHVGKVVKVDGSCFNSLANHHICSYEYALAREGV